MYIYIHDAYIHTHTLFPGISARERTPSHIYIHDTYIHTHTHTHTTTGIHAREKNLIIRAQKYPKYSQVCMYACIYVYMFACMYVSMYACI